MDGSRTGHARRVHDAVQSPAGVDRRGHGARHRGLVPHVGGHEAGAVTARVR